jgi:two-component system, OmpR family, sensor histidine kinase TctE
MAHKARGQTSLFGEIIDWMLAPLLIIWPISIAADYFLAYSVAGTAFDQQLKDRVIAVARQVSFADERLTVDLPPEAIAILDADELDEVLFQVRGPTDEIIAGETKLGTVEFTPEFEPQTVYFRNETLDGLDTRIAYSFAQVNGVAGAVLIQVAETGEKRARLASGIVGKVLAWQFVIVPLGLFLVWLGLSRGIEPLNRIGESMRNRRPQDLSPIDRNEAPEEAWPLIDSINELMARLKQSLKGQQRFIADAAHQLKTPLAGLRTQADLALRGSEMRDIQHTMKQIAASADRAGRLVNQLLLLARTESDQTSLPPFEAIDIDALVRETTLDWVPTALEHNIDLGFEALGGGGKVAGNALLLRELINNLLDNAIRYTPPGGRVTTRVTSGERVILEIEDDGIGIDQDERERVFERFYRVLGTGAEGSGLGLAIVREIVELHEANVLLLPNPAGRGTLARVIFPRSGAAPLRLVA